jgi:hypothetical protein
MTNYLALDLGTKCGYAFNAGGGKIGVSHWNFTPKRGVGANTGHYGARFMSFAECLVAQHGVIPIGHILYEEVCAHKGTRAAHIYGGFLAVLAAWAGTRGIPMTGVGVKTIKLRITGLGNASKDEVMLACKEQGHNPKTFDEADALALLIGVLSIEAASIRRAE